MGITDAVALGKERRLQQAEREQADMLRTLVATKWEAASLCNEPGPGALISGWELHGNPTSLVSAFRSSRAS